MKIQNITITLDKNEIYITIEDDSDIFSLFYILKGLCTWGEHIPKSIYRVTLQNQNINFKEKRYLNFFRRMDLDEFIDDFETGYSTILTDSGDCQKNKIIGWEIRYENEISEINFKEKCIEIARDIRDYTESLTNNKW